MRAITAAVMGLCFAGAAGCGGSTKSPGVCGSQRTDTQSDPLNCGACGNVCPTPLHASAACTTGVCGRGLCEPGWYDIDAHVPGCESGGDGVTAPPLPQTGLVFQAFASGSSYGDQMQRSTTHVNVGVLGEPTPPAADGRVSETSLGGRENVSGLNAMMH